MTVSASAAAAARVMLVLLAALSVSCAARAPVLTSFGTGLSANILYLANELEIFNHTLTANGKFGVMTHFWCTGAPAAALDQAIFSYYVDDEAVPSIVIQPYRAAGAGFPADQEMFGNRWIGKNAVSGGWVNNFRIPFQRSIRVTGQLLPATNVSQATVWTIVRGTENLPTNIGGYQLPETARLVQQRLESETFAPLDWVPLLSITNGSGVLFFHTIAITSQSINFIEGCYHGYTPYNQTFPGLIVGTGTEDYFSSAFAFDGGLFHSDLSGCTHQLNDDKNQRYEVAAYRFHDQDPVFFNDGFRFVWRNGDVYDVRGFKCIVEQGTVVGTPTKSVVSAYTYAYVW